MIKYAILGTILLLALMQVSDAIHYWNHEGAAVKRSQER
jgi:hypothetical protein